MIGEIENAILARLRAADLGYRLSVESYGGELDDTETLTGLLGQLPGVWVLMKGLGRAADVPGGYETPCIFSLFVATKNLRNEAAARRGGKAGEIGAYQIVMDLRAALKGSRLGLEIDPIRPGRVTTLFNGRLRTARASVWACEFETSFVEGDQTAEEEAAETAAAPFRFFNAYWDIPPIGNVQPPLPPAEADATDIVTLPQGPEA